MAWILDSIWSIKHHDFESLLDKQSQLFALRVLTPKLAFFAIRVHFPTILLGRTFGLSSSSSAINPKRFGSKFRSNIFAYVGPCSGRGRGPQQLFRIFVFFCPGSILTYPGGLEPPPPSKRNSRNAVRTLLSVYGEAKANRTHCARVGS